jgi:hypothetical protein
MSLTDTYEVEDIGVEAMWLRCRRCGRTWKVYDATPRGSWRCPGEPHDTEQVQQVYEYASPSLVDPIR